MSMHKIPVTADEEEGLRKHGLAVGTPSQLSDCFRLGMAWQKAIADREMFDVQRENAEFTARLSKQLDTAQTMLQTIVTKIELNNSVAASGSHGFREHCPHCKRGVPDWNVVCPHCGGINSGNM